MSRIGGYEPLGREGPASRASALRRWSLPEGAGVGMDNGARMQERLPRRLLATGALIGTVLLITALANSSAWSASGLRQMRLTGSVEEEANVQTNGNNHHRHAPARHNHSQAKAEGKCHGAGCSCDCSRWDDDACDEDTGKSRCAEQCCGSAVNKCKSRGGCNCDCSWKGADKCKEDDGGCCWLCCCGSSFLSQQPEPSQHCFDHEDESKEEVSEEDESKPVVAERAKPISLYCFALMMPTGYERTLVQMQQEENLGIFACDATTVYSDKAFRLAPNLHTSVVNSTLKCDYGGEFGTALNADIFFIVWAKVLEDGIFRAHSWTVKADPDTVFMPWRLAILLQDYEEAPQGVYLNNCKYGLHGPLEVLSRHAVLAWTKGFKKCVDFFNEKCSGPCWWGEDMFMDQCLMLVLGVRRENSSQVLSEKHCDPVPGWDSCEDPRKVAFHPFKSMDTWQVCAMKANHRCPKPTTTTTVTSTTSATRTTTFTSSLRASQYGMAASDIYSQGYQGTASSQASSTSFACSTMCDFNQTADTCEAHYQLIASSQFAGSEEACASAYALVLRICPGCWRCSLDDARCVSPALIAMSPMAASADQAAAAAAAGQSADRSPAPTAAEDVSTSQAAFDEPATDTVDAVEEPAAYPAAVDVPTSQPSAEPSAYPAATDSPSLQAALDAAEASAYQAATDFPGPQAAEEAEEPSGHAAATDFPQPAPYPATTDVPSPQAAEEVAPFAASADVPASGAAEEAAPFAASADMPASGAAGAAREPTPPVAADVPAAQAIRAIPARQDVAESAALSSMGAEIVTFQDLVRQRTSGAGTSPDAATQGAVKVASPAAEALDASAASTSAAAASTSGAAAWDDPYNCNADYKDWKWGWSSEKAVWCCKHFHRGCRVES